MEYQRLRRSLVAMPVACLIAWMVIASLRSTNPLNLSRQAIAAIALSTLVGTCLAYADTLTVGILVAIFYATAFSILGPSLKAALIVAFVPGALLGGIFHRYPVASLSLAVMSLGVLLLATSIRDAILFAVLFLSMALLNQYYQAISLWLSSPFQQLRQRKNSLFAFFASYVGIAGFFGLLFHNLYLFKPQESFEFAGAEKPDNFITFLYLSVSALNSAPPAEIALISSTAKLLVTLESLIGLFLLVIFIQFFLTEPKGARNEPKKGHGL